MTKLTRPALESAIRVDSEPPDRSGVLDLFIPVFEHTFEVNISIADRRQTISDKTIETINDLVSLTMDQRIEIRRLLHQNAIETREEVAFGDPHPPADPVPTGFLQRLFYKPKAFRFVPLSKDDSRHPCFFRHGLESVEEKIKWAGIRIDEHANVKQRFALIDCYPAWEEEHGVTIVLRNGLPTGVGHYDLGLEEYD